MTATVGTEEVTTTVTVKIEAEQNGVSDPDAGTGSGGWGGVGGEGPGVAVDDTMKSLLEGAATPDTALTFLYPYDGTVWPLGLLPPLLQWTQGAAPAEAVYIHLTSDHYEYKGYFGRPQALPAGSPLVRHPIPQDVWKGRDLVERGRFVYRFDRGGGWRCCLWSDLPNVEGRNRTAQGYGVLPVVRHRPGQELRRRYRGRWTLWRRHARHPRRFGRADARSRVRWWSRCLVASVTQCRRTVVEWSSNTATTTLPAQLTP